MSLTKKQKDIIKKRREILELVDLEELEKIASKHAKSLQFQTQRIFKNFAEDLVNHVTKRLLRFGK